MKIKTVSVRKLITGPGYNNVAVEAQAAVESHETPDQVREELSMWVDQQIARHHEVERTYDDVRRLREELHDLTKSLGRLRAEITKNRAIISSHEKLGELAEKMGINSAGLPMDLPF